MFQNESRIWKLGKSFFRTATINSWYHLLEKDQFKELIIGSLRTLVKED